MFMASVDKDTFNAVAKMTDVHAGGQSSQELFSGVFVFGIDAFPAFALQSTMKNQNIDGAYGRGFNDGRGVVGEGGDRGPGVVGIAGSAIVRPDPAFPRAIWEPPFPARAFRAGVVGLGADPEPQAEPGTGTNAIGVLGIANAPAVVGRSRTTGVVGDGRAGQYGVEGAGSQAGVYGHVDFANPNPDGAGVMGAAAIDLDDRNKFTGRAGV